MRCITALALVIAMSGPALADDPNCTSESKDKWISESDMKAKIASQGYKVRVFKVTKGNCYEIYGWDKTGKRIEIYFNPVTGSVVKEHRS
ncbi:MAG TPA: PepSY domain-containing protein [Xanthobacteraceae bacterium]|nr:PepSY domain-containing protein [Xanthobacteraceae bacterium]